MTLRGKYNGAKHITEAWDVGIIMAENLRFLGEGSSAQGKSGAKARPDGVVDAHTVEIP